MLDVVLMIYVKCEQLEKKQVAKSTSSWCVFVVVPLAADG